MLGVYYILWLLAVVALGLASGFILLVRATSHFITGWRGSDSSSYKKWSLILWVLFALGVVSGAILLVFSYTIPAPRW